MRDRFLRSVYGAGLSAEGSRDSRVSEREHVTAPHPAALRIAFDPAAHASLNGQHGTWESRIGRGAGGSYVLLRRVTARAAGVCEPKRAADGLCERRTVPHFGRRIEKSGHHACGVACAHGLEVRESEIVVWGQFLAR
ncbi:hypothetical protein MRX96_020949 [Rhipicephalus microplus]